MKRLTLLLIMLLCIVEAKAQTDKIKFDDGTSLTVVSQYQGGEKARIERIVEKTFTGEFYLSRRAGFIFGQEIWAKLNRTNPKLTSRIGRNPSEYSIVQNGQTFDAAADNSLNYNCSPKKSSCSVKGKAIIVMIKDEGNEVNVLVVKSIRKIGKSNL